MQLHNGFRRFSTRKTRVVSPKLLAGSSDLWFESGKLAPLADGAVVATHGETTVLATAVSMSLSRFESSGKPPAGFMPLMVEAREKFFSVGEVPKNRTGREMGAQDSEILLARVVDRSIRPLFLPGYFLDTQVIATLLTADGTNAHDTLAINAASAALCVSDIPWTGPVAAVRVALLGPGEFIAHPTPAQMEESRLNLLYVGTGPDGGNVVMLEADGQEVPSDEFAEALRYARASTVPLLDAQRAFAADKGVAKRFVPTELMVPPQHVVEAATAFGTNKALAVLSLPHLAKQERGIAMGGVREEIKAHLDSDDPIVGNKVPDYVCKRAYRELVLERGARADGRGLQEVRPLEMEVGLLPRVHGSAHFCRGDTHTLCVATLDSYEKRTTAVEKDWTIGNSSNFLLQYDFPPYSVNEVGRVGGINRRMIGHGKLAEKALTPMLHGIGPQSDFPYFVKISSEVTASDGSSSMASVCGASLALFDAGVPLASAVAGVSVGLMTSLDATTEVERWAPGSYELLSDIRGLEDHYGDMDFKVAGTTCGLTAVQLDIKLSGGVPLSVLCDGLVLADDARMQILRQMNDVIARPNVELKDSAPQMSTHKLPSSIKGAIIGKAGVMIKKLESQFGATINLGSETSADGMFQLNLMAASRDELAKVEAAIHGVVLYKLQDGDECHVTVTKVRDAGANIRVRAASPLAKSLLNEEELDSLFALSDAEGFVPLSLIQHEYTEKISDVVSLGDSFNVTRMAPSKDGKGAGIFSRKHLLPVPENLGEQEQRRPQPPRERRPERRPRPKAHQSRRRPD